MACIEAAGGVASERKETNRRVISAGRKAKKRVLSFRRVAAGIASVRRRDNGESSRGQKRQQYCDVCGFLVFHDK
jgi:hypothetical protein